MRKRNRELKNSNVRLTKPTTSALSDAAATSYQKPARARVDAEYRAVLADAIQRIRQARYRAAATVNRELVHLYWYLGKTISEQQQSAQWGDAVVEQFGADLRGAFPDMKGLTRENLFRATRFYRAARDIDRWLAAGEPERVATASPHISGLAAKVATVSPQSRRSPGSATLDATVLPQLTSPELARLITAISWSHHKEIIGAYDRPAERYFYMAMAARERWSVRELRRQIDADLFGRYVSVNRDPEKCLPDTAESGDLLPFKDHYVLEFLGLQEEYSEIELRKAILDNLRDFFLEFGRELTFVGEEYPLVVGADTFHIDLVFYHRRLQCLIAIELKKGKFKPEYAGKSRFYCAALDELIKLPDENPSLGLVLCRSADAVQVRLALTDAAEKIGVATYQTALPDERLIRRRVQSLPEVPDAEGGSAMSSRRVKKATR